MKQSSKHKEEFERAMERKFDGTMLPISRAEKRRLWRSFLKNVQNKEKQIERSKTKI